MPTPGKDDYIVPRSEVTARRIFIKRYGISPDIYSEQFKEFKRWCKGQEVWLAYPRKRHASKIRAQTKDE